MADSYRNMLTKVYKKIFKTLYAHTNDETNGLLKYMQTFQSRFYPVRGGEFEHQSLYPFMFLSFVEQSSEAIHAMPNIVKFESQLGITVMQYNDGDVNLQGEKYFQLESNGDDTSTELTITGESFGYNNPTGNSGTGFIDNDNTKKGIIEIVEDVKSLLYNKHKLDQFGIEGVDWNFAGVSDPTTTSLQPLLLSPYIEAKQININVRVIEDRNYQQLGD